MARNIERDEREANRRKDQLMKAGFSLFSRYGIEAISLQKVADAADVGAATMYKYYQTKAKLVIAISGKVWGDVWQEALKQSGADGFKNYTAYECIAFYADLIIRLYRERPELLKFSSNYKTFIRNEAVAEELLKEHLDVLEPERMLFHRLYEMAKIDGSMRTDISEEKLFTTVSITMLSVAERYAQGIVWADNHEDDHTQELIYLKEMMLMWLSAKKQ